MLVLFSILCHRSLRKSQYITVLNEKNWEKTIDNRNNDSLWVVVFYGDFCPACAHAAPEFIKAANISYGAINFGSLDTTAHPELSRKNGVTHLPTIKFFHSNGVTDFTSGRSSERIIEGAAQYFKGCFQNIDNSWFAQGQNTAVMFSETKKIPLGWKILSCRLSSKSRFGFTNDPSHRALVQTSHHNFVFLANKTNIVVSTDLKSISTSTESFFEGKYTEPEVVPQFFLPFELRMECKSPIKYCVILNSDRITPAVKAIAVSNHKNPIKFFQGDEDWVPKTLESSKYWVLDTSISQGIRVSNEEQLKIAITQLLTGEETTKWEKL